MDLSTIPSDFLNQDNQCGQSLLKLVARGHAIIAEITRLSDFIPPVFRLDPSNSDTAKYNPILMDFSYFVSPVLYDSQIESSQTLLELDRQFKENYFHIILRFYAVFESIYKYAVDINRFVEGLKEGVYIQLSLESVFQNNDGKQLLCELLYLYGIMLYLLEISIEGVVRERLLVAYYRYGSHRSSPDSAVDQVGKLIRSISPISKTVTTPRDSYFARLPISENYISLVILKLRSDELYGQSETFPLSEERSAAYSGQAAMLCIALFFSPGVLHDKKVIMREIVDRFFPDNWIITLYTGVTVNLIDIWAPYKAAFTALLNTLQQENVKNQIETYILPIPELTQLIIKYLRAGAMEKDVVSKNIDTLLGVVRRANVSLRWSMLHVNNSDSMGGLETSKKRWKHLGETLSQAIHRREILNLFIAISQMEFELFATFEHLIQKREETWQNNKAVCTKILTRLSNAFDGTVSLAEFEKNESYQKWFMRVSKLVESLHFSEGMAVGRKIASVINSIQNISGYKELQGNLQAIQLLTTVEKAMHKMFRAANTKSDLLNKLQAISDAPYLWPTLKQYVSLLQSTIKEDPSTVTQLRAAFLKIASVLNYPLIRINEASSPDLASVSQHYSTMLVDFIEGILQIIPKTIIENMSLVASLLSHDLREMPSRMLKSEVRDYIQLDKRYQIAEITNSISLMAQGILVIETTLVGVVKIDFKELLDNGIRREVVGFISQTFYEGLVLPSIKKTEQLEDVLVSIERKIKSFAKALEYVQDYICIQGLMIWQQELNRTVLYYVERECNVFLKNKILDWSSSYQSAKVPIRFHSIPGNVESSFIGVLAAQLLDLTDPWKTLFVLNPGMWMLLKDGKSLDITIFDLLFNCFDVPGLRGLDRYFGLMICDLLQKVVMQMSQINDSQLTQVLRSVKDIETSDEFSQYMNTCFDKFSKIFNNLLKDICTVGQVQILRKQISLKLHTMFKLYSERLETTLSAFDNALVISLQQHYLDSSKPNVGNHVLAELNSFLESGGFSDPFNKIYITPPPIRGFASLCTTLLISMHKKLIFGSQPVKGARMVDGTAFAVGMGTLMKQHHQNVRREFLEMCCLCLGQIHGTTHEDETFAFFIDKMIKEGFFKANHVEEHFPVYYITLATQLGK